jgi:hypothetical protein
MVQNNDWKRVFCETTEGLVEVETDGLHWNVRRTLESPGEQLLQLKLDKEEEFLLGTTCNGFR